MPKSASEGLIIANGQQLSTDKLFELAAGRVTLVLDGAYNDIHHLGLEVEHLLGDFDSIAPQLLADAKKQGINIVEAYDQNYTDLEKGIHYFRQLALSKIHIVSATGLRLDHTLHNIQLLTRYHQADYPLVLHTESESLFIIKDQTITYEGKIGNGFALLGAPHCTVSTEGLKYDMQKHKLSYTGSNSICNSLLKNKVTLEIHGTALVIASVEAIDMECDPQHL